MDGDPTTLRWTFLGWDALRFSWPYVVALVVGVVGPMWLELAKRHREKLIADAVAEATRSDAQETSVGVATAQSMVTAVPTANVRTEPLVTAAASVVTSPKISTGPLSKRAEREARRLRAWQLYQSGMSQVEIARTLGVTRGAVSQWMKTAREEGGPDALVRKAATGRPSRLSEADKTRLAVLLEDAPSQHGFDVDAWNNSIVAELIEREFDVSYHPVHVARMLKKLRSSIQ